MHSTAQPTPISSTAQYFLLLPWLWEFGFFYAVMFFSFDILCGLQRSLLCCPFLSTSPCFISLHISLFTLVNFFLSSPLPIFHSSSMLSSPLFIFPYSFKISALSSLHCFSNILTFFLHILLICSFFPPLLPQNPTLFVEYYLCCEGYQTL